jgi:hypothetical protein
MQSEYYVKGVVKKVQTLDANNGTIRLIIDIPLLEKTSHLTMTHGKDVAVSISLEQAKLDAAAGQMGLFDEKERENESEGGDKEFFGAE